MTAPSFSDISEVDGLTLAGTIQPVVKGIIANSGVRPDIMAMALVQMAVDLWVATYGPNKFDGVFGRTMKARIANPIPDYWK